MAKNKKSDNIDNDDFEIDDSSILEEDDDIDLFEIEDSDEDIDDDIVGVEIEDSDEDIDNIDIIDDDNINTKKKKINNISDINVVKCPNCKEDVLEANLCPICGKELKHKTIFEEDTEEEYNQDDDIANKDFFDVEDNYIPDGIDTKIDEDYYE